MSLWHHLPRVKLKECPPTISGLLTARTAVRAAILLLAILTGSVFIAPPTADLGDGNCGTHRESGYHGLAWRQCNYRE